MVAVSVPVSSAPPPSVMLPPAFPAGTALFWAVRGRTSSLRTLFGNYNRFEDWHNEIRPHSSMGGAMPDEVFHGRCPANRRSHSHTPW